MTHLFSSRIAAELRLDAVIATAQRALVAPEDRAVALIYTPGLFSLGQLSAADGLSGPPGSPLGEGTGFAAGTIAHAEEVRVFHPAWEIRWLRREPAGRAALLWDSSTQGSVAETDMSAFDDWSSQPAITLRRVLHRQYLLWGEPAGEPDLDGWVRLTSARLGTQWAPLTPPEAGQDRVVLNAREYLAQLDHGNVAAIEERISHLSWAPPAATSGEDG